MFKPAHNIFFIFTAFILLTNQAHAAGRFALVIGNSAYTGSPPLKNPKNDAELISKTLIEVGFKVSTVTDASQRQMRRAMLDFSRTLRENKDSIGLFYYAGHGVQVRGVNFMVPITADIKDEEEIQFEGVDVNDFLNTMRSSNARLNIVILDACRNNPFARSFRSASRGLAPVQAASGTLIAYSTAPGDVAFDGNGLNSPYTLALSRFIRQGDLSVETVFKRVLAEVEDSTKKKQTPWLTGAFRGEFYFKRKKGAKQEKALPRNQVTSNSTRSVSPTASMEKLFWKSIVNSTNPASFKAYMTAFPNGTFRGLASIKIAELEKSSKKFVVASKTTPANENFQRSGKPRQAASPALSNEFTTPKTTARERQSKPLAYRYVFPDSSKKPLSRVRVKPLGCHKLWLARNEIYHRKGYCFKSQQGIRIFNNSNCTSPYVRLSSLESRNKRTIRTWEIRKRCRSTNAENLNLQRPPPRLKKQRTLKTRPIVRKKKRVIVRKKKRAIPKRVRRKVRNEQRKPVRSNRLKKAKKSSRSNGPSTRQQFLE